MIAPHGDPRLVIILIRAEMGGGGGDRSPRRPVPRHHTDPGRDGGGGGGDCSPRRPAPRHHTDPDRDGGRGRG